MHVLFVAPETGLYNHRFVEGLVRMGARVSGVGHAPREKLAPELAKLLAGYRQAKSVLDGDELVTHARALATGDPIDRVETIDEPAIASAARVREVLEVPGLTPAQARLSRDKAAMKELFRSKGIPCAASSATTDRDAVHRFVEQHGLPIVVKPREGFGTLDTYKVTSSAGLERVLDHLKPSNDRPLVVEEFVEGHEGFLDAVVARGRVVHDFVGHYYPTCLEALQDRAIRPKIACTNRVESPGYRELREVGQRVIEALGLVDGATHMEWFFGPKGLKVSEVGARPAGERIWDMHVAGNELDLYGAWARAVMHGESFGTPTRKYAVGSVQIRPDRDGTYVGHDGVDEAKRMLGSALVECEIPPPGTPTQPMDRGWHVNTWFRVRHEDYDEMRAMLDHLGRTVKARAK